MNFTTWLFKRIKDSMFNDQFEWIKNYRRMILQETVLSIVLTLLCGVLYILFVGFLLIPYIDRAETAAKIIYGLVGSVAVFYVYHWLMAQWCHDTFGASTGSIWAAWQEPGERWYANNTKFWFRDEADRTWFLLRWS